MQTFFNVPLAFRAVLSAILIGAPIYFAAVCFSRLFEKEKITGYPLGINLIGAMCGALLEYSSMYIGMRNVWLVLLGVYLLAMVSTRVRSDTS